MRSAQDLGRDDLVLCSGTLLGHGLNGLVEGAVAGGFAGITLWPQDVAGARAAGLSDGEMRALVEDHGLVVADLDPLLDWTPQALPRPGEAQITLAPEAEFYAMAETFGARSLNVAQGFGAELDLDRAAEDLAGVCDRAAEHGLLITVEFLPWSGIPTADVALDLVRRVGRPNATVMLDTWHWFRGGADLALLRALPADSIGGIQLNDAPADVPADLVTESMQARLMPGEGAIPLGDVLQILTEKGVQVPIGVEVFHARHASLSAREIGLECGRSTRRVIDAARVRV